MGGGVKVAVGLTNVGVEVGGGSTPVGVAVGVAVGRGVLVGVGGKGVRVGVGARVGVAVGRGGGIWASMDTTVLPLKVGTFTADF